VLHVRLIFAIKYPLLTYLLI